MTEEEQLKVIITAQTDSFKSAMKDVLGELDSAEKSVTNASKKIEKSFGGIGKMLAKFVSIGALVKIGKDAVEMASNLQEVQNVVDVSFGEMSYKAEEFAKTAIKSFGMSELSAKQTASTYMAMAKSMGLSMEDASNMAIEVAKLTGDVASFYNISQDLASTKLKSIFTGETETLKQIGVVMTETNLQQFALQQGITKSFSSMSQAEKVALRYKYVMDALSDASGDFARTSGSWANQTRILTEQWKSFLGIIGNGLVQVLTPLIRILNSALSTVISFAQNISNVFGITTQTSVTNATSSLGGLSEAYEEAGDSAEEAGKKAKKGVLGFDEITNLQQDSGSSGVGGAGGSVLETLTQVNENKGAIQELKNEFSKLNLKPLKKSFDDLTKSLKNLGSFVDDVFKDVWENVLKPLGTYFVEETAPASVKALANTINILVEACKGLKLILDELGILSAITNGLTIVTKACTDTLKVINDLGDMLLHLVNPSEYPLDGKFFDVFGDDIMKADESLKDFLVLVNPIQAVWNWLFDTEPMQKATNKINEFFGNVIKWIGDIPTHLSNFAVVVSDIVTNIKDGMLDKFNKLKDGISSIWDGIKNVVRNAINGIIDSINRMISGLETALNVIVDLINKIEITNPFTGKEIWSPHLPTMSFSRIPKLAKGGVVDSATLAMVGESGKEAIVPLENNTEWMDKMATKVVGMMQAVNSLNNENLTINVPVELKGKVIAQEIIKDLNLESIRRGYKPILNV